MILQFFFQGKSSELVKVFSHASAIQRPGRRDILARLDITNATAYKELK